MREIDSGTPKDTHSGAHTGGCQCGAVRYQVSGFGRASICHCRMCQKAFGNAFAPLVTVESLEWTRGAPTHYQSSNMVRRGFCCDCGTPLTYEFEGLCTEIALCTLDDPWVAPPTVQVGAEGRLPWCEAVAAMPGRTSDEDGAAEQLYSSLKSFQHPDHDTRNWPAQHEAGDRENGDKD